MAIGGMMLPRRDNLSRLIDEALADFIVKHEKTRRKAPPLPSSAPVDVVDPLGGPLTTLPVEEAAFSEQVTSDSTTMVLPQSAVDASIQPVEQPHQSSINV